MNQNPEPTSVTSLELYRQGARVESKVDRLDDKLDGHGERISILEHRADAADRAIVELKDRADKQRADDTAGRRWGIGTWLQALAVAIALVGMIVALVLAAKAGVRP